MRQALIKLHTAVLLAGLTGVLGKLISLQAFALTWYRLLFASVLIVIVTLLRRRREARKSGISEVARDHGTMILRPFRDSLMMCGVGLILGVHWVFFYASIHASNVSIGVLCYALVGFYTAFLDPLVNRRRIRFSEIVLSLLTLSGILLIFGFDSRYRVGIGLGFVSSLLAALFTVTSKKVIQRTGCDAGTMNLHQIIGGAVGLTIFLPLMLKMDPSMGMKPCGMDIVYLLILAFLCTVVQYDFQIQALQKISAFTVNLTYNLEPIYSIAIAMLFLGEATQLNFSFYLGLLLIFTAVALQTWQQYRSR